MKDCRECKHATRAYSGYLCLVGAIPRPTNYMRDPRELCGLEARMFEPAATSSREYEDDRRD